MTLISSDHGSTSPTLWLSPATAREARTLAHENAEGGVIVVHRTPGPRRGTLALFYATEAGAAEGEALHAAGGVLTITEPGRPTLGMAYVVTGRIRRELDTEYHVWTVEVEVCEVPA